MYITGAAFLGTGRDLGTSLVVQWLRLCASTEGAWVRSVVRELRSHMPPSAAEKKKQPSLDTGHDLDKARRPRIQLLVTEMYLEGITPRGCKNNAESQQIQWSLELNRKTYK